MADRDVTTASIPPYLPQDPNRVTAPDVERMIHSQIAIFWESQRDEVLGTTKTLRRKALYKNIAIGVAGFVGGVGTSYLVGRIRRGNQGATQQGAAAPRIVAMK